MVNVFSFCLYGPPNPRYYDGLLGNIDLITKDFPNWKIFVYLGSDVAQDFIDVLKSFPNVVLRETGTTGHKNSIYRCFAIDEPGVELMMVRDADSRVHWKDRWAIRDFLASEYGAHVIRDHIEHTVQIPAGLWGVRKRVLNESIQELFNTWTPRFAGSGDSTDPYGFGIDQNFLKLVVYPKIKSDLLVHYSKGRLMVGETGKPFPFEWTNNVYCGRIELRYIETPERPKLGFNLPMTYTRIDMKQPEPPTNPQPQQQQPFTMRQPSNPSNILNFLNRK